MISRHLLAGIIAAACAFIKELTRVGRHLLGLGVAAGRTRDGAVQNSCCFCHWSQPTDAGAVARIDPRTLADRTTLSRNREPCTDLRNLRLAGLYIGTGG